MRPGLHLTSWFYTMLALLICGTLQAAAPPDLERYNVVWTTPSQNAAGSMPLGNGEVGLNLWVEENGDLLCYLARTGTWSEACRLLKLGRLRLQLSPNPFTRGTPFRQELKLRDGCVEIVAGPTGNAVRLRVFVDATAPVIFVTGEADQPHQVRARLETWRNDRKVLAGEELLSSWTMQEKPRNLELWESADIFSDQPADAVTWYHRNQDSIVPLTLRLQSLEPFAHLVKDPLLNRTFGGRLAAPGFKREGPQILTSEGTVRRFALQIATHCAQTTTLAEWEQALGRIAARHSQARSAAKATAAWWAEFWDRSWLFVEGDRGATVPANQHPLRLGADSNGQSLFAGRISRASVFQRALAEAEIRSLAAGKPGDAPALSPGLLAQWRAAEAHDGVVPNRAAKVLEARAVPGLTFTNEDGTVAALFNGGYLQVTNDPRLSLSNGFTLEAWIQPKPGAGPARLFDKLTAGVDDGFLFDTYPDQALRLIVGPHKLSSEACLKPGQWQHVAATFDAATGNCRLYLNGTLVAQSGSTGETTSSPVTRAYVLQRWMTACAGRGQYPIKFNGSIFTVDPEFTNGPKLNADWRRWGDAFWWQNTRLPYFPMLARGDFDQVAPLFRFYREALPLARARAKAYFNAEGAYFPETMTLFGTCANRDYGWDRTGRQPNEMVNLYIRHIWQQGLELCALMLEYYDYTRDHQFLARELVPLAHEALRFYETRFPHDGDGRLRIEPTQSVETYWYEVVNDTPSVAGLHAVLTELLALDPDRVPRAERDYWLHVKASLPALPLRTENGKTRVLPAGKFNPKRTNVENPELYAVWPFRLYGIGRPGLEIGQETFSRRQEKSMLGWSYDAHCAALLGLTDEASRQLLVKAANSHPAHRFPAMWGPNYDWLPDQDHGSCLMLTLQTMLLQSVGNKIYLRPAWPKDWNAHFKLHAPQRTVLEGKVIRGKVTELKVTPRNRYRDVIILP